MNLISKRWFCTLVCALFLTVGIQAQVAVLQYRAVPAENVEEFLYRETTYWAEVAQKAVNDGKLVAWELWQPIGGFNMNEGTPNFVFVNIFPNKEALNDMGSIWNPSDVFPNARAADIETGSLSTVVHQLVVEPQASAGRAEPGNFARVNYSKVVDMESFLAFETGTWQPFIDGLMKEGKTSCVQWSVGTVLSPTGSVTLFDAFSVDHYETLSEAIQPTWEDGIEFPDFTGYGDSAERLYVGTYALIKSVR